jgi:pSer/pThr/pTyr-binding forkhead associated (FHA) protein
MAIVLVIKDMGDVHSVHLSSRPIVLGRSAACDVKISDEKVSGRHLALKLNAQGRVMIKDLETTNGTLLNGANITESYLMIADKLKIGDVELGLDDSQMSPREKIPLARDDAPTQIKYIPMSGENSSSNKMPQRERPRFLKKAPVSKPEEVDESTAVQSEEQLAPNERVGLSAQKVSQDQSNDQGGHKDEKIADLGAPPNSPEELNVSVDQKTKPDTKKKRSTNQKKPKKKSLFQGFLQIFKGH